jgi:thiol-disulfide isomerase/thioredoxin
MTKKRIAGGALLSGVLIVIALIALTLPVDSAKCEEDAYPPARPGLTGFEILQKAVVDNDKNDVKIAFSWNAGAKNLRGGVLKLSVSDDNGAAYTVSIELLSSKFARQTGKARVKARLVCSASEWLKVTARLVDADRRTSKSRTVTLPSLPHTMTEYKIDWPLGTEAYRRAFDFSGFDKDGKKVSLWDFYGKVIFVEFGTMWCGPCDWMAADIRRMWKKWKNNKNVVFISIFHEGYVRGVPVTQADLEKWASKHKYGIYLLGDPSGEAFKLYADPGKPTSVPQYMFIDPYMQISFKGVGWGPNFFYDQINDSIKYMVNRWFQ